MTSWTTYIIVITLAVAVSDGALYSSRGSHTPHLIDHWGTFPDTSTVFDYTELCPQLQTYLSQDDDHGGIRTRLLQGLHDCLVGRTRPLLSAASPVTQLLDALQRFCHRLSVHIVDQASSRGGSSTALGPALGTWRRGLLAYWPSIWAAFDPWSRSTRCQYLVQLDTLLFGIASTTSNYPFTFHNASDLALQVESSIDQAMNVIRQQLYQSAIEITDSARETLLMQLSRTCNRDVPDGVARCEDLPSSASTAVCPEHTVTHISRLDPPPAEVVLEQAGIPSTAQVVALDDGMPQSGTFANPSPISSVDETETLSTISPYGQGGSDDSRTVGFKDQSEFTSNSVDVVSTTVPVASASPPVETMSVSESAFFTSPISQESSQSDRSVPHATVEDLDVTTSTSSAGPTRRQLKKRAKKQRAASRPVPLPPVIDTRPESSVDLHCSAAALSEANATSTSPGQPSTMSPLTQSVSMDLRRQLRDILTRRARYHIPDDRIELIRSLAIQTWPQADSNQRSSASAEPVPDPDAVSAINAGLDVFAPLASDTALTMFRVWVAAFRACLVRVLHPVLGRVEYASWGPDLALLDHAVVMVVQMSIVKCEVDVVESFADLVGSQIPGQDHVQQQRAALYMLPSLLDRLRPRVAVEVDRVVLTLVAEVVPDEVLSRIVTRAAALDLDAPLRLDQLRLDLAQLPDLDSLRTALDYTPVLIRRLSQLDHCDAQFLKDIRAHYRQMPATTFELLQKLMLNRDVQLRHAKSYDDVIEIAAPVITTCCKESWQSCSALIDYLMNETIARLFAQFAAFTPDAAGDRRGLVAGQKLALVNTVAHMLKQKIVQVADAHLGQIRALIAQIPSTLLDVLGPGGDGSAGSRLKDVRQALERSLNRVEYQQRVTDRIVRCRSVLLSVVMNVDVIPLPLSTVMAAQFADYADGQLPPLLQFS